MSNNKLFVGNLSFDTTENDLQDTFAAHGSVVEANLVMDRESGRPRGFELALHAPRSPRAARGGREAQQRIVPRLDERNQPAGRIRRIAVIQPGDHRQNDQEG